MHSHAEEEAEEAWTAVSAAAAAAAAVVVADTHGSEPETECADPSYMRIVCNTRYTRGRYQD